jgi:hypothetical protein
MRAVYPTSACLEPSFGPSSLHGRRSRQQLPVNFLVPSGPIWYEMIQSTAKDVNGLVEGMELLQEDFDTLYAKAQAAKPSARQIRIGLLRVPGTDPAIDRAIEARLVERGFQIVSLGDGFRKAWRQAQRDGNLVAAAASWYNNQAIRCPGNKCCCCRLVCDGLRRPSGSSVRRQSCPPGTVRRHPMPRRSISCPPATGQIQYPKGRAGSASPVPRHRARGWKRGRTGIHPRAFPQPNGGDCARSSGSGNKPVRSEPELEKELEGVPAIKRAP